MQSPLLTTPTQYDYDNPVVETNERILQQWVDQLPLLNVAESIDALFNAIKPLNEQNVHDKLRLRLLEIYRQPVLRIAQSFDAGSLRHLPISQEQRQHIIDDIAFLILEMANGYKILVKQGFLKDKQPGKDQNFLLSIYRAMEMLSEAVIHSYQIYSSPSAFAFLEFHQLFQYAERNRVADTHIKKTDNCIMHLYIQLMLLAIVDPYRMPEGEVRPAYDFLTHYTQICLLSVQPPLAEEDIGIFTVDLSSDNQPVPVSRNKVYKRDPDFRLLDVRPVLATLLQQVKKNNKENQALSIEEKILSRVVPNLTAVQQRSEPRRKQRRKVNVAQGMHAVHFCLSGKLVREELNNSDGIEVMSMDSDQENVPNLAAWVVANESQRGFLLYQPSEMDPELNIGDIVGIENESRQDPDPSLAFNIAAVRWMRLQVDNQNQIGVEILSRHAKSATLMQDNQSQGFPCLYLTDHAQPRLLTPPLPWPDTLCLAFDGQRQTIMLNEQIGESPFYRIFMFRFV